jgi:Ca2+-binding EF-hand superfamily protein
MCAAWHAGELDLEEFARAVREEMGISPYRLTDDALAQLFVRIDAGGTGRIDAVTLKRYASSCCIVHVVQDRYRGKDLRVEHRS